jgi:hypothetical protein
MEYVIEKAGFIGIMGLVAARRNPAAGTLT